MFGITGLGQWNDYRVMQSAEDADKIIALFENAAAQGYNPYEVEDLVYSQANVNPSDLDEEDRKRISATVQEIYQMQKYSGRRF